MLFPKIYVPAIDLDELFDDLFTPIARDSAAFVEVGLRLQKVFAILARLLQPSYRDSAFRHSQEALARAELEAVKPTLRIAERA
ncbi:hypothetical protein AB4Z52_22085 [Rhizobium sp. 2YAF20]|uniref:hypothetical protein n=1 Tax=Rhizobium sp. 2YAF20 TaxID=3233027 RepID=UPI003F9B0D14